MNKKQPNLLTLTSKQIKNGIIYPKQETPWPKHEWC